MVCHTRAANYVLGLTTAQMNREHDYAGARENQLAALGRIGCFSGAPSGKPESLSRLADPRDDGEDLDRRARSYLHVNCSPCHVEAGGGNAQMQLEYTRSPERMSLFGARPQHDTFGIQDAKLVAPGDPERSVLLHRVSRRGGGQMPPLATTRVDGGAAAMLRQWIARMPPEGKWAREWTLADLLPALEELGSGRDFAAGKAAFQQVGCAQCHRFALEGGTVGPDLGGVGKRLAPRELLESILDPSKAINDEFAAYEIATRAGELLIGGVEREDERELVVRTGSSLDGLVRIAKAEVVSRRKSALSNMPSGILNVLERDRILDLLAYLIADGAADAPAFKPR
jgi:putative heme-binding domain-containing protein